MATHTITALFDKFEEADAAVRDLVHAGIDEGAISIVGNRAGGVSDAPHRDEGHAGTGAGIGAVLGGGAGLAAGLGALAIPGLGPVVAAGWLVATLAGAGVGAAAGGLVGALTRAGISREHAHAYEEGIRRGGTLVTVRVDDDQEDVAADVLERHDPADIDGRQEEWKAGGWTGEPVETGAVGTASAMPERDAPVRDAVDRNATAANPDRQSIPIVEEQLAVGKRQVDTGRVRVRSYVVETPIEEQVDLREERVNVERRPVDRSLGAAPADAFQERTIEATETSEEPVVQKSAHVREEVVLNKDVRQRPETVRDTVRRTEVEVDDDRAGAAGSTSGDAPRSAE
ncbi:MAG: hypothetical protein JWM91_4677 [Rhodospirillales bacterium]|nr:hypothetical protein [Rhodospirillales bacterium]